MLDHSSDNYSHGYHAGNVGDVWKHLALVACLGALKRDGRELLYLETHAGAGRYVLGPTGEWSEGVGKLDELQALAEPTPSAARHYVELLQGLGGLPARGRGGSYPGSPILAAALLAPGDRLLLHELAADACAQLQAALAADSRATVRQQDGFAALRTAPSAPTRFVLIDPPYTSKEEWAIAPDALAEAYRSDSTTHFLLWYPIKSLTRPQAMSQRLRAANVPATVLELMTTPLELKRNRLNGSGVLLVNPPRGAVTAIAAAAPVLGALCATHEGRWFSRGVAWDKTG